jgi:hypothetical protein
MSLEEIKIAEYMGRLEAKVDAFERNQGRQMRILTTLNICGMTGGAATVGTQIWPSLKEMLTLMGGL